ncbi:MAG: Ig-like domain-containing protein [Pelagimonas sp.]|nr:Ig-like domain-containing protein [Pelagimonas sp.]
MIRTRAGTVERGTVAGEGQDFLIPAGAGNDISLNLRQSDLRSYDRAADDLLLTLADGQVIVLEGYFATGGEEENRLFLSADGTLNEVTLIDGDSGALYAQYGPTETWGKWSPSDELIFIDQPRVVAEVPVFDPEGEEVSMLAGLGLLGAGGAASGAAAAAAGVAGLALLGSGDGESGGDGPSWQAPTVDDPDGQYDIGGDDTQEIVITGTANPGSVVTVVIDGVTREIPAGEDRSWEIRFSGDDFPQDGDYQDIQISVEDPDGRITVLDGPSFTIDTTPPALDVSNGTESTGDLFNAEGYETGVTINGTAEVGSVLTISVGDFSTSLTVDNPDGSWSYTFDPAVMPTGEYTQSVVISAKDSFNNITTITETVVIDTVPHPLVIDPVGDDNVINLSESEGGFQITGSSTPGAVVTVSFGTVSQQVTTGADGRWSLSVSQGDFAAGEYTGTITASTVDQAGNSSSASWDVQIDTVNVVNLGNGPLTGDDVISDAELNAGVTLTGTTQAGSTVTVTIGGVTLPATVDANGNWSVSFGSGDLTAGSYATQALISSTDLAGNTVTATHDFNVDTEVSVTLNTGSVATDGVVNASERAPGVLLTGTAEPGSSVSVTVAGTELTATVAANGDWSVTIPTALVPEGETSLAVSATATDIAGNSSVAIGTIAIDTTTNVGVMTANVETDGVVNAAEHSDGVTLTGNAEPGASVVVTLGAVSKTVTAGSDGSWQASWGAAEVPTGETTLPVTAIATDLAGNTATASSTLDVDTYVRNFGLTSQPGGADGVVNAAEAQQGLTLTGTTEPGGTVMVTLGTVTLPASVDASGNWTVTYSAAQIPMGEQSVTLTAVSTDLAGNSETLTQQVSIDTDAGILTISPAPVEGDDVVNFAEASDGVVLTGTSNPGEMVTVTLNGVSHTVQTAPNGIWTAPFGAHEVAPGTYTAQITATITDTAGNTLTRTDSVRIDTEVRNFATSVDPIEGDNVINHAESQNGVTLQGTTEPGGSVQIVFDGMSYGATVDASGNWSVDLPASALPSGEVSLPAQVLTTDLAGNTAETQITLVFDTLVNTLDMSDLPVTADNVINAAEAASGVTLNGQVEAGSSVTVTIGGVAHVAHVDPSGSWQVAIPPESIPTGDLQAPVLIEATDAAGNTTAITEQLTIDTDAPNTPSWEGYGRSHAGIDEIRTEISDASIEIGHVVGETVQDVAIDTSVDIDALGLTYHSFANEVADGSHLVLMATDTAGNSSGAYLVTDDPATSDVTMTDGLAQALSQFQVETIDLDFAEDSHLTITEAQITALSSNSDTLVVEGGADDSVTITGAQSAGTTVQDGETYNVFSLGDATLLIDDDITNINGLV